MASRSPMDRPFSLPPIWMGMSVTCQVLPRSLERRMAPLPTHEVVYVPAARYTLLASTGSAARLSMPGKFDSRPRSSVRAIQLLSAGFQRYAPPTSVRAYTRSFSTELKKMPLTNPPPRMATFFQL